MGRRSTPLINTRNAILDLTERIDWFDKGKGVSHEY